MIQILSFFLPSYFFVLAFFAGLVKITADILDQKLREFLGPFVIISGAFGPIIAGISVQLLFLDPQYKDVFVVFLMWFFGLSVVATALWVCIYMREEEKPRNKTKRPCSF